jgi:hypothetical protein
MPLPRSQMAALDSSKQKRSPPGWTSGLPDVFGDRPSRLTSAVSQEQLREDYFHRTAILTPLGRECASRSSTVCVTAVRDARPGLLGTPGLVLLGWSSIVRKYAAQLPQSCLDSCELVTCRLFTTTKRAGRLKQTKFKDPATARSSRSASSLHHRL